MVMAYAHAPAWNEKMKAAVRSVAGEPWLLAWNIGDDLQTNKDLDAARKVRDELRAMDPLERPIGLDAIGMYEDFAKIPDLWCAYAYPLVKPATDPRAGGKPGGLRQYQEWLSLKQLQGRTDALFWTWAQCHVQVWYNVAFLGGKEEGRGDASEVWRPSPFPDGDHLRLIAAHAISAGCRGLMWFVHYYFQDDRLGRDRYARAAMIGCELDVVGPLVAQGRVGTRLRTSDPTVWATPIDFPGARLVCLVKTGDLYHYQPDAAEAEDVQVDVGVPGRIYQIGHDFRQLHQPRCSFALTSWLLATSEDSLAKQLRERHVAVQPDMARFAAEELEARIAKTARIFEQLGGHREIQEGRAQLAVARQNLEQHRWSDAGAAAESGLSRIREAQHRLWNKARTDLANHRPTSRLTDFYLLPEATKELRRICAGTWGPDQLPNGAFESDQGWSGVRLGHDARNKAVFLPRAGRGGSRALRLKSDAPTVYQGVKQDWVTVSAVSERLPAEPGQLWEVTAWVRVPKTIEQTARGVTMSLFAYAADGKPIAGYAQDIEATQVGATPDWRPLRLVVPLRTPQVASFAVRLSLCGVGEALVDDVTVRRLEDAGDGHQR